MDLDFRSRSLTALSFTKDSMELYKLDSNESVFVSFLSFMNIDNESNIFCNALGESWNNRIKGFVNSAALPSWVKSTNGIGLL